MPERRPSLLLLGTQMEFGGAQGLLLTQARWFHDKGYRVRAVFLYDKMGLADTWSSDHPFPVINLRAWNSGRFWLFNLPIFIRGLFRLVSQLREIDAIEAFTSHSNLIGIPLAWMAGVKVRIASLHGYLAGPFGIIPFLHGRLVNSRLTSKLVAVSDHVRETAVGTERLDPAKIVVIPNGIAALSSNSSKRQNGGVRREIGFEKGTIVLAVGRLVEAKGHATLLEAWATLQPADARLVILGDGPLRTDLEDMAGKLGIGDAVVFLGSRNDVREWLEVADIYVQPSLREGLSIALLEAMSAGKAIVASTAGAAKEMIEDGNSGLLVAPGDSQELAMALRELLTHPEKRQPFGDRAREKALADYSSDQMCQAYEELILQLFNHAQSQ